VRLSQWPRSSHDRTIRQLSGAPPEQRAQLLVAIYDSLDPLIRPLAIDEMGMSGQAKCISKLIAMLQEDDTMGFARWKVYEAKALCPRKTVTQPGGRNNQFARKLPIEHPGIEYGRRHRHWRAPSGARIAAELEVLAAHKGPGARARSAPAGNGF